MMPVELERKKEGGGRRRTRNEVGGEEEGRGGLSYHDRVYYYASGLHFIVKYMSLNNIILMFYKICFKEY